MEIGLLPVDENDCVSLVVLAFEANQLLAIICKGWSLLGRRSRHSLASLWDQCAVLVVILIGSAVAFWRIGMGATSPCI